MAIVKLFDIDEDVASKWAMANCSSFQGWLIVENDAAFGFANWEDEPEWIFRYEFEFDNEQEALIFQLRWQGQ